MKSKLIVSLAVVLSSLVLLNNLVFAQSAPGFQKLNSDRADCLQFAYLPITPEIAQGKDIRIPGSKELKPAASQPVIVEAKKIKTVTEKLAVLADALFEQRVRGLAKRKLDNFMTGYLTSAAVELTDWLTDTNGNKDFQKLFKGTQPVYLVFLAMSPSSMGKYMNGLDMPGFSSDVLGDKKLPVNMSIKHIGENLIIEMWGAHDLSLTFKINAQNKVELIG